jgi:hypothetical protein
MTPGSRLVLVLDPKLDLGPVLIGQHWMVPRHAENGPPWRIVVALTQGLFVAVRAARKGREGAQWPPMTALLADAGDGRLRAVAAIRHGRSFGAAVRELTRHGKRILEESSQESP